MIICGLFESECSRHIIETNFKWFAFHFGISGSRMNEPQRHRIRETYVNSSEWIETGAIHLLECQSILNLCSADDIIIAIMVDWTYRWLVRIAMNCRSAEILWARECRCTGGHVLDHCRSELRRMVRRWAKCSLPMKMQYAWLVNGPLFEFPWWMRSISFRRNVLFALLTNPLTQWILKDGRTAGSNECE